MEKVYDDIIKALNHGEEFVVAVIRETNGSVPRKAGTTMILRKNGEFYGTVGGGAAERDAQADCQTAMKEKSSFTKTYGSGGTLNSDNMICGGSLTIDFTYVDEKNIEFRENFKEIIKNLQNATVRVWVAGAGHVAQALVPLLLQLSFECHVLDDRSDLLNEKYFPKGTIFHHIDFTKVEDLIKKEVDEQDFICIMTKGHKDDYAVLMPALKTGAYYVGLMGSRSKIASLYKALRNEGFDEETIQRCHSPIGLNISAETPLEVAISVSGELIYQRSVMQGRNKY